MMSLDGAVVSYYHVTLWYYKMKPSLKMLKFWFTFSSKQSRSLVSMNIE